VHQSAWRACRGAMTDGRGITGHILAFSFRTSRLICFNQEVCTDAPLLGWSHRGLLQETKHSHVA
jgi:hypothetical protein